ncbi:AraC family transcriptional regulator [Gracilibacillus oryzae]|uniref:AraC family transcriptional regulator n=1 Tax=Gracilibacillus oryzae TaxID=1672701 RepID=A0A7C8GQJ8_9BACI|nr:AraC family transcriptional regulator [Gracilibacillus oryzae]KAB8125815.1 AraC family transcriptional regulator [Gracilibacillus oryzae]
MQILEYVPNHLNYHDLYINQFGKEQCYPKHHQGPRARDYYLIHYIKSGKGIFEVNGKSYQLEAGQGFLICPDVNTFYQADEENPWYYYWVGFNGIQADSLLSQAKLCGVNNPIFEYNQDNQLFDYFEELIRLQQCKPIISELKGLGSLYSILSTLIHSIHHEEDIPSRMNTKLTYVKKVTQLINDNYAKKITISEIANRVGLDRSYLNSLFKSVYNKSIQEFLIQYRIRKACELLEKSNFSVSQVARFVGYEDPLQFSKTFKKVKGTSPKYYRLSLEMEEFDANI